MENISAPEKSLLVKEPSQAIPYVVLTAVVICLGLVGNSLILAVYLTSKEMRKTGNEFIVNLAAADICSTGIAGPLCIRVVTEDEKYFLDRPWFCQLTIMLCLTACLSGIFSLTIMTVNRWLSLCHKRVQHLLFGRRSVNIATCLLLWVVSFGIEVGNVSGWGKYVFNRTYHACFWIGKPIMSHTVTIAVFVTCPMFIMIMSHVCIFRRIRRSKCKVHTNHMNPSIQSARKKAMLESMRASRVLLIVLCLLVFCWSPYVLVTLIDLGVKLPYEPHLWVTWLAHLNSALNFLIYSLTHRPFRSGLRQLIRLLCPIQTIDPSPPGNEVQLQNVSARIMNVP